MRRVWLYLLGMTFFAWAVYLAFVPRWWSASHFEAEVREHFPPGTRREAVETWVRAQRCRFVSGLNLGEPGEATSGLCADIYNDTALTAAAGAWWPCGHLLILCCYFDRDGRLLRLEVSDFAPSL
jgi:hypothetical protein